ncbi:hypothetical protein OZX62_09915 [Bifidobacterium sp. ESL0690]|uniref:hypothetical protein n=1 Tax=Bifidobacterium sp. ESL0690 TaxID=2983214 RepID=UPI0023F93BBF|nr:hypothetical protein [Bifidobacterium sp. ESL0690]WEV46721.1 hypothetical protein OZX62_09915 [Bifidobacterium sp. ESL0690]
MFERIKKYKKDREWHWDDSKAVMYTGEEAQKQANAVLMYITGAPDADTAVQMLLEEDGQKPSKRPKRPQLKISNTLRHILSPDLRYSVEQDDDIRKNQTARVRQKRCPSFPPQAFVIKDIK